MSLAREIAQRLNAKGPAFRPTYDAFDDLKEIRRFVAWHYETRNGKSTKTPINPANGDHARSNDPSTWATLEDAVYRCDEGGLAGVGIMLGDVPELGTRLGGVDLDACRDPATGKIASWASEIINIFGSFTEVSPSGLGVHILAFGAPAELPTNTIPIDAPPASDGKRPAIESYVSGRYFTVTGQPLAGSPDEIRDCGDLGDAWDILVRRLGERAGHERRNGDRPPLPAGEGLPDDVHDLLATLSADCPYEEWVKVGMALHHADPERGLPLWDEWSASAPDRYPGEEEIQRRWASFHADRENRVTIGTLRHLASVAGRALDRTAQVYGGGAEPTPSACKLPRPMGVTDLLALQEPAVEWLAEGFLPADANFLLAAYPKSYKTMLLLALALALATGTPFLGRFAVPGHRRVGLVLMEDAAFRVRRRIERILGGLGLSMADVEGRLFLWFRPPLRLTDQTVVELGDYAAELDLDFLGVDSWAYVASGDSNSADEVTPQLQALSALKTRRPGLTVGLAHHAAKGRDEAGTEMRLTDIIRNSGAFGAWYDVGVVLSRRNETSPVTVRMEMRDQPAPDPFAFTVEDEYAASPQNNLRSSGWLRLEASDEAPQTLERRVAAERLVPAVREFLRDQDGWVSGNKLREGVGGRAQDVDAALNLLVKAGNAEFIPSPGRGKAALSRYLVPPRPNLVPDDVLDRPSPPRPVPVRDEVGGVSTPPPGPQTSSVRDEVAAILEGAW